MKTIEEILHGLGACEDAVKWSEPYGTDRLKAWMECKRGDYLLWILGKNAGPPKLKGRKKLVLASCRCARLALPYTKDRRVKACLATAERWAKGKASIKDLRTARAAAAAASYTAAVAYVGNAASYTAAAAYAAFATERTNTLTQCADIVRQFYPTPPQLHGEASG